MSFAREGYYKGITVLLVYRAEIINYYANLTKEATLREERAMWKIRRSVLDQARHDFLSEDEQAWREEMEANPEVNSCHDNHKKLMVSNFYILLWNFKQVIHICFRMKFFQHFDSFNRVGKLTEPYGG